MMMIDAKNKFQNLDSIRVVEEISDEVAATCSGGIGSIGSIDGSIGGDVSSVLSLLKKTGSIEGVKPSVFSQYLQRNKIQGNVLLDVKNGVPTVNGRPIPRAK
jgi:hypothetical protein